MLVATSVAIIAWMLMEHGITDPAGRPVGTDFFSYWTVSVMLNMETSARFIPRALAALEQSVVPGENVEFCA